MASTTVTEAPDRSDWREGLVVLPPDHVYGATALTAQEWAARGRRGRARLVCTFTATDGRVTTTAGESLDRALADAWFDDQLPKTDAGILRYGPHSGHKVRVLAEDEWRRVRC